MPVVDWLNDNQGFATVLLTAALVAVTIFYALQTRRAVQVAQQANDVAERAQLGALIVLTGGSISAADSTIRYTATNIGAAPALNVKAWLLLNGERYPSSPQRLHLGGRAVDCLLYTSPSPRDG